MHFKHSLKRTRSRLALPALAAAALLGLNACLTDDVEEIPPGQPFVFAVTSDYKTGSYSAYGLDSTFTAKDIEPIHSDAVVRYLGGSDIFLLNRYKRDNLQIIDRKSLKTVQQIQFPALSNPYDVALKDGTFYVAFYSMDTIQVYRQSDGALQGVIDVSAYADSLDKNAETTALLFVGNDLYALLANLDSKTYGAPFTPHLLKIDVATKTVSKSLKLPYGNPTSLTYDAASGKVYIPCRGEYTNLDFSVKKDGALISVDLSAFAVAETLATEATLGGNLNPALLHDGKLFLDVGADGGERIVAIGLKDKKVEEVVKLKAYKVGGLAIDAATNTLFVGDRDKGLLRLFNLTTLKEKDTTDVNLGLAPNDLAIIR